MNEWITSIQPPGLMKMRLMHYQEHHLGHQAPQTILDEVCHPHNAALPHEQLHGVVSRTEQGRVPNSHTLHGRALKHKMPLIMKSMQILPLPQWHKRWALGTPVRRPSTTGNEWLPILKRSNVRMQRALRGCRKFAASVFVPAEADHNGFISCNRCFGLLSMCLSSLASSQ